jgi:serine-type D-Ala-D-Ala carboxypeptidase
MSRLLAFLAFTVALPAGAQSLDAEKLKRIEDVTQAAIQKGSCPGAVVTVIHHDKVAYQKAFGNRQVVPEKVPMTTDTVFDMASLTKPMATGTSILLLLEQGKLKPSDPVSKYWPEFAANEKKEITLEQCLVHTTGLTADNSITDYQGTPQESYANIAKLKLEAPPGTRFKYSDVGFIVLGEIVKRVSGKPLNEFASEHVFKPLTMSHTGYKPDVSWTFAPTGMRDGRPIFGSVHDPRAFALGGVAGHAGLFSTSNDVVRYCRMLLRNGELDGVRILKPETVKLFTEAVKVPTGQRSRGWDVNTSFSAPRGELFPIGESFGHTGFTGTSVWIDPTSKTAVIILTNRLHPDEKKGNVTELRKQIATIVAGALPAKQ